MKLRLRMLNMKIPILAVKNCNSLQDFSMFFCKDFTLK